LNGCLHGFSGIQEEWHFEKKRMGEIPESQNFSEKHKVMIDKRLKAYKTG
jgi:hypothetical protein